MSVEQKKLSHGLKISKPGFDVVTSKGQLSREDPLNYKFVYLMLIRSYLYGAEVQVKRYREAAKLLGHGVDSGVLGCLHELSSLLEDLYVVASYAWKAGLGKEKKDLWSNLRNHIRHDLVDDLTKGDNRKVERLKYLGMEEHLMSLVGFGENEFKIGSKMIYLKEIEDYLLDVKYRAEYIHSGQEPAS